jgi:SnoaL-like domain
MDRRTVMMRLAIAGSGVMTAAAAQSGAENPLIAAFAQTLSAHDINGFAALFADDYVNHQMSAAAPKPAPDVSPKQATVGFFAGRLKGMPDLSVAIRGLARQRGHGRSELRLFRDSSR